MGMSVQIRVSLSFQAPNMQRTRSVPTLYFRISPSPAAGLSCDLWGRKACGVFLNYCCAAWKRPFCNCSLCRGFEELRMQTREAKSNLNDLLFVSLKERSTRALLRSRGGSAAVSPWLCRCVWQQSTCSIPGRQQVCPGCAPNLTQHSSASALRSKPGPAQQCFCSALLVKWAPCSRPTPKGNFSFKPNPR